jgi:hypothetical protein
VPNLESCLINIALRSRYNILQQIERLKLPVCPASNVSRTQQGQHISNTSVTHAEETEANRHVRFGVADTVHSTFTTGNRSTMLHESASLLQTTFCEHIPIPVAVTQTSIIADAESEQYFKCLVQTPPLKHSRVHFESAAD